jgi:hypothetical protein
MTMCGEKLSLTFAKELEDKPFAKMLLLAAVLASLPLAKDKG